MYMYMCTSAGSSSHSSGWGFLKGGLKPKQEVNETVDEFITDLYCLVEHCDFGALHDELVQVRSWHQRQQTLGETTDGV